MKEFAQRSDIEVMRLDGRELKSKTRKSKRKMQGGEISVPVPPTPNKVKEAWTEMVETGELSLEVPCSPFTLMSYRVNNGQLEQQTKVITGRKFPLLSLRQQLLARQADEDIQHMTKEELLSKMSSVAHTDTLDKLRVRYKAHQCTRTLAVWHDHATILGLGTLMVMVHVVYDPAVFYKQTEIEDSTNIQLTIEQPEIHIIAA